MSGGDFWSRVEYPERSSAEPSRSGDWLIRAGFVHPPWAHVALTRAGCRRVGGLLIGQQSTHTSDIGSGALECRTASALGDRTRRSGLRLFALI